MGLKEEVDALMAEAKAAHSGYIFDEYKCYSGTTEKDFKEHAEMMLEYMEDYCKDEPDDKELNEVTQKMKQAMKDNDVVQVWKHYFEWYPSHGEYAGTVAHTLIALGKLQEAKEILLICKGEEGFGWDT